MAPAIELIGITKRFPGVIANDDVNLTVEEGEIHAICGENGAGKSTLMKILYGMQPADEGVMRIRGEEGWSPSPTTMVREISPTVAPPRMASIAASSAWLGLLSSRILSFDMTEV